MFSLCHLSLILMFILDAAVFKPQDISAESGQVGSVRIKQEPEDSGLYGINPVPSVNVNEIHPQIKIEPGTEKTIKQEKDTEWINTGVVRVIKTEPVDPEISAHPPMEHCHQCPVHAATSDNKETETVAEIDALASQTPGMFSAGSEINQQYVSQIVGQPGTDSQHASELGSEQSKILPDNISQKDSTANDKRRAVTSKENLPENTGERNQNVTSVIAGIKTAQNAIIPLQHTSEIPQQLTIEPLARIESDAENGNGSQNELVKCQLTHIMDVQTEFSDPYATSNPGEQDTPVNNSSTVLVTNIIGEVPTTGEPPVTSESIVVGEIISARSEELHDNTTVCKDIGNQKHRTGVPETQKTDGSTIENEKGAKHINLDDILSETVDRIYSDIREKERSDSKVTCENIVTTVDESDNCENLEESSEASPLRHSVEDRRQEALEFLKELNSLQAGKSTEKSVKSGIHQIDLSKKESGTEYSTLPVRTQKVRPSFELDKILSDTVDRIYSEIHSETSSMTGSLNTNQIDDENQGRNARENDVENQIGKQECLDKVDGSIETKSQSDTNEPNVESESGTCEIRPIVIEPENDTQGEPEKGNDKSEDERESDTIKSAQDEESKDHNKTQDITEFLNSAQLETVTINIEPGNYEINEKPESIITSKELEPEKAQDPEGTKQEVEEKSENVVNAGICRNEDNDNPLGNEQDENLSNSTFLGSHINDGYIGSLTIEADNEEAALRSLVRDFQFILLKVRRN